MGPRTSASPCEVRPDEPLDGIASLLTATRPGLLALARSRGLDSMSAQDVIQDAFLALVVRWTQVANPEAWLVCVVRRRCRDWIRRRRRSPLASFAELPERPMATRPSEVQRLTLAAAVARLSPRQRRLLVARFVEGRSERDAAQTAGYAPSSYKKTMSRTLRKLRSMLADAPGDTPPDAGASR